MTKKAVKSVAKVRQGGGVYVDGKRVGGTEPAGSEAHDKRVAEREARKAGPIKHKETDNGR